MHNNFSCLAAKEVRSGQRLREPDQFGHHSMRQPQKQPYVSQIGLGIRR